MYSTSKIFRLIDFYPTGIFLANQPGERSLINAIDNSALTSAVLSTAGIDLTRPVLVADPVVADFANEVDRQLAHVHVVSWPKGRASTNCPNVSDVFPMRESVYTYRGIHSP